MRSLEQIGALKTIRPRRQRETDYDNEEKQLLEISLFDGETTGICLTFWDAEQIRVGGGIVGQWIESLDCVVRTTMDTRRTHHLLCWSACSLR